MTSISTMGIKGMYRRTLVDMVYHLSRRYHIFELNDHHDQNWHVCRPNRQQYEGQTAYIEVCKSSIEVVE